MPLHIMLLHIFLTIPLNKISSFISENLVMHGLYVSELLYQYLASNLIQAEDNTGIHTLQKGQKRRHFIFKKKILRRPEHY